MYAIIETGGKQYRVEPGLNLWIEKIDAEPGEVVSIEKVLFVNTGSEVFAGTPFLPNWEVKAEVVRHLRDRKIVAMKYRPKKNYRRKYGHRQWYTEIRIKDIVKK